MNINPIEYRYFFIWFIIYAFIGWIYETTYCSIKERKFVNRGFLYGPVIPIYGVGAMVIILVLGEVKNIVVLFLSSMVVNSIIEYFTSWAMEKLFNARWWDYSRYPFNINGRICLYGALVFGVLSVLLIDFINPFVVRLTSHLSYTAIYIISALLGILFISDLTLTVINVLKLNEKLRYLHTALDEFKKESNIEKNRIIDTIEASFEKSKFYNDYIKKLTEYRSFNERRLLKAFPRLRSLQYNDALSKMKESLNKKRYEFYKKIEDIKNKY